MVTRKDKNRRDDDKKTGASSQRGERSATRSSEKPRQSRAASEPKKARNAYKASRSFSKNKTIQKEEGRPSYNRNGERPAAKRFDKGDSFDSDRPRNSRSSAGRTPYSSDKSAGKRFDKGSSFDSDKPRNSRPAAGRTPYGSDKPTGKRFDKGSSFDGDKPRSRPSAGRTPYNSDKPTGKRFDKGSSFDGDKPRSRAASTRPAGRGRDFDKTGSGERATGKLYNDEDKKFERRPLVKKTYTETPADKPKRKAADDGLIRLNRYLSNAGVSSRRKADELIVAGEVTVNGEVITELGYKVNPTDKIKFSGKLLKREQMVYVLLNKPKDYITTTDDPQERRTVMDLVKNATRERIYPVGRLDRNTMGLLLLTNDGDLAQKLSHPRNKVKKIYEVTLDRNLSKEDFEKIVAGVELEDGMATVDELSFVEGKSKRTVGIEIHIGRNRIVRRLFEHLGYEIEKLDRVLYAGLTKKDLSRGRSRHLSQEELIQLKHMARY
jgi:23S rRNA pseudouridine2605 synthase